MRKADGKAVVIKKEEVVEGEGHGGAWKVAYADFVTAMMAFFLLMWLLNATTEDQRKGLADYFSPNNLLSHASSGTGDPFGGHTAFDSGAMVSDRGAVQVLVGNHPTSTVRSSAMSQPAPPQPASGRAGGKGKDSGEVGTTGIQTGAAQAASAPRLPMQQTASVPPAPRPAPGAVAAAANAPRQGSAAQGAEGLTISAAAAAASLDQASASAQVMSAADTGSAFAAGIAAASGTASATHGQAGAPPAALAAADAAARTAQAAEAGAAAAREEAAAFASAAKDLLQAVQNDPALAELAGQLKIDMTPEGLRIQILDRRHRSMFALGSAAPNDRVRMLLQKVTPILLKLPEQISIAGYTDATPFPGPDRTNWELSSDRANAARRLLVEDGLPSSRIQSVIGHADRDPLLPKLPFAAANRRIAIVVLRDSAATAPAPLAAAPAQ